MCGVCGMDVGSAGCARCVGWMQAECGGLQGGCWARELSAVCEVCAGVCLVSGGARGECKVCGPVRGEDRVDAGSVMCLGWMLCG